MKEWAALKQGKYIVGFTLTEASNGEIVSYGFKYGGDRLREIGKAKITRNKQFLKESYLQSQPFYDVNYGGGKPI